MELRVGEEEKSQAGDSKSRTGDRKEAMGRKKEGMEGGKDGVGEETIFLLPFQVFG